MPLREPNFLLPAIISMAVPALESAELCVEGHWLRALGFIFNEVHVLPRFSA